MKIPPFTHTHTHTSEVLLYLIVQPYDHKRVVAKFHLAGREEIQQAIDSALEARAEWERTPFEDRY